MGIKTTVWKKKKVNVSGPQQPKNSHKMKGAEVNQDTMYSKQDVSPYPYSRPQKKNCHWPRNLFKNWLLCQKKLQSLHSKSNIECSPHAKISIKYFGNFGQENLKKSETKASVSKMIAMQNEDKIGFKVDM